jgi:carboxyl-terminal processing protease
MRPKKMTWWIIIAITISLIIGIIIGNIISGRSFGRKLFLTANNKISVILDIINEDYVDPVNMKDITEGAIRNIISELDPHSIYIPDSELPGINDDMDGYFGGLGVDHVLYKDTIVVMNLMHGGPASQAGLLPGDRIITVNDSVFTGPDITEEKIMKTLRGPIGSPVKLGIRRDFSDQLIEFTIKRSEILMTTVKAAYEVDKGIGFIKIYDKFSHTTYDEFVQAMTKLVSIGCTSFIIDLRSNSGGSYEAAIKIINEFLPAGRMIVYSEGKSFPRIESISDGSGNLPYNQMVILMDQMSASASEIVAGAIQDNDRGLIIGRHSFGKGLVQKQIALSDGSAVRLTIARYYTPAGRNIQRKYELGKTDEYNREWLSQLANGEGFFENSLKQDSTLAYQTVHGRTVYGGGGIMPDIFVPLDTSKLTTYYLKLENHDIFNQFAFDYSEENHKILSRFKTDKDLLAFLKTQPILNNIVIYAEHKGIKRRSNLITKSANQILTVTYACIVRDLFGEEAFFKVYLQDDPMIQKAIEAIQKGYAAKEAIVAEKYKFK